MRSRRAVSFAQWSFFGDRKETSSYWRLVSWIEHKETRKSCFFFFFSSSKCHHIHLLLQALGRRKKENLQEAVLATPVTTVFLCTVCLKDLGCTGWWSIWWASLYWAGCCMALPWGHRSWLLLRLLGGKVRGWGKSLFYPFLNRIGRTDSERGGNSSKYRNIGTGLPLELRLLIIFSLPISSHRSSPSLQHPTSY